MKKVIIALALLMPIMCQAQQQDRPERYDFTAKDMSTIWKAVGELPTKDGFTVWATIIDQTKLHAAATQAATDSALAILARAAANKPTDTAQTAVRKPAANVGLDTVKAIVTPVPGTHKSKKVKKKNS